MAFFCCGSCGVYHVLSYLRHYFSDCNLWRSISDGFPNAPTSQFNVFLPLILSFPGDAILSALSSLGPIFEFSPKSYSLIFLPLKFPAVPILSTMSFPEKLKLLPLFAWEQSVPLAGLEPGSSGLGV